MIWYGGILNLKVFRTNIQCFWMPVPGLTSVRPRSGGMRTWLPLVDPSTLLKSVERPNVLMMVGPLPDLLLVQLN